MARVLTACRVRVPAHAEAEYLATLRELAGFASARGQRIFHEGPRVFPGIQPALRGLSLTRTGGR